MKRNIEQLQRGFIANLVVALSVAAYGSVLGVLAAKKGVLWYQLLIMNLSVFAGSAQFVMVDMWLPPLPVAEMVLAAMVINMRYMLIGASLQPLFHGESLFTKMTFMHLVADENWAMTMGNMYKKKTTIWFLFGGGLCVQIAWCLGTMSGHAMGQLIEHPEKFGLDFAFIAVFTALVFSFKKSAKDIIPWLVAGVVSYITAHYIPGKWYIIAGGVSGALVAASVTMGKADVLENREKLETCGRDK